MNQIGPGIITVITGIIGLAMVAVVVSRNAQTGQVLSQGGSALANVIKAAVTPVSGNGFGSSFGGTSSGNLPTVLGGTGL